MKKKNVIEAEIIEDKTVEINKEENSTEKTYFLPRLIAYILDIVIVGVVITVIGMCLPADNKAQKALEEYEKVQVSCLNDMKEDTSITAVNCMNRSKYALYDYNHTQVPYTLIGIVVYIGYFIVFQFYNKGQTLGKKLMKIKLVDTKNNNLTINQLAIRSVIIDSIGLDLLTTICVLLIDKEHYIYSYYAIQALLFLVIISTLLMIFIRKDGKGLHDVAANTQVVNCK